MTDTRTLGPWLRRFLAEHLVSERNLARNTQRSYRDTLVLLLPFVGRALRKPVDRLAVLDLTSERVLQFLAHLEDARGCSVQTRNLRLTAICSFARFVGSRSPEHVEWCTQIRALPRKKAAPKPISYLEKSEIDALLDAPSRATRQGHRDRALLLFLYNTGVRASEAAQLTVGDLQLTVPESHPSLATVHGKGGKVRQCPLWPRTASLLAALVDGRPAAGAGLPQPERTTDHPLRHRTPGRAPRHRRRSPCAVAHRQARQSARDSPHHGDSPAACRRRPQHDPGVARPRQTGHDQYLCRNRPRDEGQGNRFVRRNRTAGEHPLAGGHRLDGVPANAISARRYVALIEPGLLTPQGGPGRTQHNRQRNIMSEGTEVKTRRASRTMLSWRASTMPATKWATESTRERKRSKTGPLRSPLAI